MYTKLAGTHLLLGPKRLEQSQFQDALSQAGHIIDFVRSDIDVIRAHTRHGWVQPEDREFLRAASAGDQLQSFLSNWRELTDTENRGVLTFRDGEAVAMIDPSDETRVIVGVSLTADDTAYQIFVVPAILGFYKAFGIIHTF